MTSLLIRTAQKLGHTVTGAMTRLHRADYVLTSAGAGSVAGACFVRVCRGCLVSGRLQAVQFMGQVLQRMPLLRSGLCNRGHAFLRGLDGVCARPQVAEGPQHLLRGPAIPKLSCRGPPMHAVHDSYMCAEIEEKILGRCY